MKKSVMITVAMIFAFASGYAYAGMGVEKGDHSLLFNGVTNFTGLSYDTPSDAWNIGIAEVDTREVIEGASAGGARDEMALPLFNGVTDFTGRSYDAVSDIPGMEPVEKDGIAKGISAGGARDEMERHLYNGVTDFTGRSYDAAPDLL